MSHFASVQSLRIAYLWKRNWWRLQSQKTQGFCVADFATLSDETRSRSKIFPLFIWIKEPCVENLKGSNVQNFLGFRKLIKHFLKFTSLKARFKQINENQRLTFMHVCSGNLYTKFHNLSFINNLEQSGVFTYRFFKLWCETVLLARVILHSICYWAFSLWFGFINTCSIFGSDTMNHVYRNSLGTYFARTPETWLFKYLMHWGSVCV